MNLTLSLGISNGGSGRAKKCKLRDVVGDDDVGDGGGDRGRFLIMRLLQARERMMASLEPSDQRKVVVSDDDDDAAGGIRLMHLLLSSVAAREAGDAHAAAAALLEVYRCASFRAGDPVQRVAAHFADALASSRLLLRSPAVASASPLPTRAERFLAYTMFYQVSPLYQLAHFTANQAIVEAFDAGQRRRLHVVDFDVSYGFQWPSLIQSLSDAAAAATSSSTSTSGSTSDEPAVSLRLTGLGASADELRQTEARLTRFASGCPNLRFEFEGIVVDDGPISGGRHDHDKSIVIKTDGDATVVVNLVFPDARNSRTTSSREMLLARLRSLNPSLVFLVENHDDDTDAGSGLGSSSNDDATSRGGPATTSSLLLPRFTTSLRYFAAVFDSLHEYLPADSAERLVIERNHLGTEICKAVASLDVDGDHTADRASSSSATCWKEMMESAGFEGVTLSSRTVSQAKLLLKMKSGCGDSGGRGFRVIEGDCGRAMSLGWRDTALITATAWRRRRSWNHG